MLALGRLRVDRLVLEDERRYGFLTFTNSFLRADLRVVFHCVQREIDLRYRPFL